MAYHSPKSVEGMSDCMNLQISQTEKVNLTMPSQHGALEKYNKNGRHLGEFDYRSGTQTKPADSTRWVEP